MEENNKSYFIGEKDFIPDISALPKLGSGSDGTTYSYQKEAIKILSSYYMSRRKAIFLQENILYPAFLKPLRIIKDLSNRYSGYTSLYVKPVENGFSMMTRQEFKEGFQEIQEGFLDFSKKEIVANDSGYHNLIVGKYGTKLKPYICDLDHYTYRDGKEQDAIALDDYFVGFHFINMEEFRKLLISALSDCISQESDILPENFWVVFRFLETRYQGHNILNKVLKEMKSCNDVLSFSYNIKKKIRKEKGSFL